MAGRTKVETKEKPGERKVQGKKGSKGLGIKRNGVGWEVKQREAQKEQKKGWMGNDNRAEENVMNGQERKG